MKPQLTVLIPLAGLGAYLIFKPSHTKSEVEQNKIEIHSDFDVSDSVKVDSMHLQAIDRVTEKTKE